MIEAPALETIEGLSDAELRVFATALLKRLASEPTSSQPAESGLDSKPVIQAAKPTIDKTLSKKPVKVEKKDETIANTQSKPSIKTNLTDSKKRTASKVNPQSKTKLKTQTEISFSTKISRSENQPRTAWQVNEALKSAMNRYRKNPESNALR